MVLHLLSGDLESPHLTITLDRLDEFANLEALFQNRSADQVLNNARVNWLHQFFEDTEIPDGTIDLLTSRSVLEHVTHVERCFDKLALVMRPGGVMYHDIDLSAHSKDDTFEFYSRRPDHTTTRSVARLNELRLSDYLAHFERRGFESAVVRKDQAATYHLDRTRLQPRFSTYPDDELLCTQVVLVSRKRPR